MWVSGILDPVGQFQLKIVEIQKISTKMTANIGRKWLTKGLPGDQALGAHLDSKIVCKFHQIHKRIIKIPGDGFCLLLICTSLARSNSPSYLQLLQQQWYPLPTTMERAPLNTTVPCWQPLYKHHQWQYSGIGSHGYLMPSLATLCWALKKKEKILVRRKEKKRRGKLLQNCDCN